MHYNGIPREKMHKEFKGECVCNQEVDKHFPHLTVGETLEFAASARTPSHRLPGVSRKRYIKETTHVAMAVFSLANTFNTRSQSTMKSIAQCLGLAASEAPGWG
jgi:ABC-type multidrug transport system ATPase subunit